MNAAMTQAQKLELLGLLEERARRSLRTEPRLEVFAESCLHIRAKSGKTVPFRFNRAQAYIHAKLEEQRTRLGRVRALILKGRQQGCSTYVAARYYRRTTLSSGIRTFILTHEDAATQNLFEMVNRYHEHCPEGVQPSTGAANAKELFFDRLDSGYKVGTAGTKGVGRSSTIQLFHGSEVAFWPHADTHAAGVLQAVPDEPDTEVILESTANGLGNLFHQKWADAERGIGDFIAIFVPWFWQDEYRKNVPDGFAKTDEETKYAAAYGLSDEQIAWRRNKIAELKDPTLFKQEYPATAAEAFQMSGHDSFIKPALVAAARSATHEPSGPLVIGFDPARFGDDDSALARRRGRKIPSTERKSKLTTMEGAGWIKQVIDTEKPARVFIDVGGLGVGIYDRLVEMGYGEIVVAVNFGGAPLEPPKVDEQGREIGGGPANRRAEMWMASRDWLGQEGGVDIPDTDSLQSDACAPGYKYDSNSRVLIEKKEDMRRRGVKSPDEWDAVVLTFAEPVAVVSAPVVTEDYPVDY
ncbi:hypothetical protein [Lysobacter capsici]|uniref:hypothetical protein n=1 Tax=Lysobacter capsici TaxID=435897 RepID=UPI00287B96C3|nr:hypothetical protein [Lysobacter capsici]WND79392.1 hypothetical protein RJ610_19125 [Lysobacter capsici]WND84588.1 hypothetical protein RJ609_19140 [Lysobacter capsici]